MHLDNRKVSSVLSVKKELCLMPAAILDLQFMESERVLNAYQLRASKHRENPELKDPEK